MPPRKKTVEKQSFETRLQMLEELVQKMEGGELSLSETLEAYEQGIGLTRELSNELNQAEARIQELSGGKTADMSDVQG